MASGDIVMEIDSINIGSVVVSCIYGATESLAGPAMSEQSAELCASTGGTIAGTAKYNFINSKL